MATRLKRKRPQMLGKYELESEEEVRHNAPPDKRTKSRKHFPMKVKYKSTRTEEYIDLSHQIDHVKSTDIDSSELEE